jgi:hypothetical protein
MKHHLPFALLFVAGSLASGCSNQAVPPSYRADEERPHVGPEARWWEDQAERELTRAYKTDFIDVRERQIDYAIRDFNTARGLYLDELARLEDAPAGDTEKMLAYPEIRYAASGPVPAGRRHAIEIEIDRLSNEIESLAKTRPIEEPPPLTVYDRILPRYSR